jgi:hypothetical protein
MAGDTLLPYNFIAARSAGGGQAGGVRAGIFGSKRPKQQELPTSAP